jgi:hypothetical protein
MIFWLAFGFGWPLLTVLTARQLYAMSREDDDVDVWGLEDRMWGGAFALLIGLFWPLVGLWVLVTMKPPKTTAELAAEAKAQRKHIAELEKELGWDKR